MSGAAADGGSWIKVGPLADVPTLGARVVCTVLGNIAVFRTAEDQVYALADRCPHKGGPLSQGMVFGTRVACPLHDWVIDLKTGNAVGPDTGCANAYPVRVEGGVIWLQLVSQPSAVQDTTAGA